MDSGERQLPGWVLPAAIMAAAFALRAHELSLVHFNIDEGMVAVHATKIARAMEFPLQGLRTSFGFFNPPTLFYLMAPAFALMRDPVLAQLLLVALGTAAVGLAWLSGGELGGCRGAVVAAVLVAVCPNAVEYCRRPWGHDIMVICGAGATWGAVVAVRRGSGRALAASLAAAAIGMSVHLSAVVLWLPGLVVLARTAGRPAAWRRSVVVGAMALGVVYTPWLVAEFRGGFPAVASVAGALAGGGGERDLGLVVGPIAAWTMLAGDFWTNDLLGFRRPWELSPGAFAATAILSPMALGILGGSIAFLTVKALRNTCAERTLALALLFPVVVSPLLFGGMLRASVPYYHLPALFPLLVAVAWAVGGVGRRACVAGLVVYTGASVALALCIRTALLDGAASSAPLGQQRQAIRRIVAAAGGRPFAIAQDARHPARGVDVSYAYLLHAAGAQEQASAPVASAELLFVLHAHETSLGAGRELFLHRHRIAALPNVTVYGLESRDAIDAWLGATAP